MADEIVGVCRRGRGAIEPHPSLQLGTLLRRPDALMLPVAYPAVRTFPGEIAHRYPVRGLTEDLTGDRILPDVLQSDTAGGERRIPPLHADLNVVLPATRVVEDL